MNQQWDSLILMTISDPALCRTHHGRDLNTNSNDQWIKPKETPQYQVGNQVWLDRHNLHMNQPMAKLAPQCHRPFPVEQVLLPVNYHLTLPTQWSIHPVLHTDLLMPYHKTPLHGQNYMHPPPDLIDGSEEYKVEKILDLRCHGCRKKLQYLVK